MLVYSKFNIKKKLFNTSNENKIYGENLKCTRNWAQKRECSKRWNAIADVQFWWLHHITAWEKFGICNMQSIHSYWDEHGNKMVEEIWNCRVNCIALPCRCHSSRESVYADCCCRSLLERCTTLPTLPLIKKTSHLNLTFLLGA